MKTAITHLPPAKREQLAAIVALLRDAAPVEMVILFGSYARGDWVEDPISGYQSDFDILVVVKTAALAEKSGVWLDVEHKAESIPGMTPVNIIAHDFKWVNKQIERGQYFFTDIVEEGIRLYDSGAFIFSARRPPTPAQRRKQAKDDFEHWFGSAGSFFAGHEFYISRAELNIAAFMLHQAAERTYAAALLAFTAYKPRIHNIEKLDDQVSGLHPDLRRAFPRTEPEDARLFELLRKAYVDARYSKSYRITVEELAVLGARVRALRALVERVCNEKIASFAPPG